MDALWSYRETLMAWVGVKQWAALVDQKLIESIFRVALINDCFYTFRDIHCKKNDTPIIVKRLYVKQQ